jgi:hypothetical protein
MNEHIEKRLRAIQGALMAHHSGGTGLPNAMIGSEREDLINTYLAQVLPPLYRFGRGSITDGSGSLCGQLEIVMESPFGPNFPMPAGKERLYLAESVAAVIEIKSNLYSQWNEVKETTKKVKRLTRDLRRTEVLHFESSPDPIIELSSKIPCYAVGYVGYKSSQGLKDQLDSTEIESRPDGVLVIESGCFIGITGRANGAWGLHAFVAELASQVNSILGLAYPDISSYGIIEK